MDQIFIGETFIIQNIFLLLLPTKLKISRKIIAELKLKIFTEVDLLETSKLEEFYGIIVNFINSQKEIDEWIGISENEITEIMDAMKEIDTGKGIPHYQVINKIRENVL